MEMKKITDKSEIYDIVKAIVDLPRVPGTGSDYADLQTVCSIAEFEEAFVWDGITDSGAIAEDIVGLGRKAEFETCNFTVLNIVAGKGQETYGKSGIAGQFQAVYAAYAQISRGNCLNYVNIDDKLPSGTVRIALLLAHKK